MANTLDQLGYHVEPLSEQNVGLLRPLMLASFGLEVPDGYFEWKFFGSPHGRVIGSLVRHTQSGDPASYYGMIPTAYRIGGEVRTVHHATDGMTHPDHRRKQLYVAACRATYERPELPSDFVGIGFSSHDLVKPYLMLGWQQPILIPFYFRPRLLCWLAQARRIIPLAPAPLAATDHAAIIASRARDQTTVEISSAYLAWRFANPSHDYLVIRDGASFAVYVVLDKTLFVIDFHAGTDAQRRRLLHSLDAVVLAQKFKGMLTFAQRGTRYERTLRASGFVRNDTGRGPAANRIPLVTWSQEAALHQPDAWSMTPLDHDAY
ncbi:MAG: hypothetical protein V4696_02315 [Pseudomonadota bacterium]